MSLKKKIIIAVVAIALVVAVTISAVLAATSYQSSVTASVSFQAQMEAKVDVTINGVTKYVKLNADGTKEGTTGVDLTTCAMNFGTITIDDASTSITATIVVTNYGGRAISVSITPTYNNETSENVEFSDMTTSGTVAAVATVGGTEQTLTFTQTMSISSATASANVMQSYIINLSFSQ